MSLICNEISIHFITFRTSNHNFRIKFLPQDTASWNEDLYHLSIIFTAKSSHTGEKGTRRHSTVNS